jgi:hypothetical protein
MIYSALPEILPLIWALDPVGSERVFPQELHAICVDACE